VTGRYVLSYRATMSDGYAYFVDAQTGDFIYRNPERKEQGQIGIGTGVLGDQKKISTTLIGGTYRSQDLLRPSGLDTYDSRASDAAVIRMLQDGLGTADDYAVDSDNTWTDGRIVDVHVHAAWTHDYFFRRFQWSGFNGIGSRISAIMHRGLLSNAQFWPAPFGPGRGAAILIGETPAGAPLATPDIVGHEFMHGVTEFSLVRRTGRGLLDGMYSEGIGPTSFTFNGDTFPCVGSTQGNLPFLCDSGGRYVLASNPPGTVNESFSDVFGTAIEFFYQPAGNGLQRADYIFGEDVTGLSPQRRMDVPGTRAIPGGLTYPDHYSRRLIYLVRITRGTPAAPLAIDFAPLVLVGTAGFVVSADNGGVHYNATILGHASYLAIEGGRNATSGITVQGVGSQNREQIERIFFRAMTQLMPGAPSLPLAAVAIRQAAVDLYGASSAAASAVAGALAAVGL
jgi:thermolysin